MSEFTTNQIFVVTCYIIAGAGFFILFDIFRRIQKLFGNPKWLMIVEDTVFWIIFIIVIYTMNFNLTKGAIKGYTIMGLIGGVYGYYLAKKKLFGKRRF